jgi:hypothetical protein
LANATERKEVVSVKLRILTLATALAAVGAFLADVGWSP